MVVGCTATTQHSVRARTRIKKEKRNYCLQDEEGYREIENTGLKWRAHANTHEWDLFILSLIFISYRSMTIFRILKRTMSFYRVLGNHVQNLSTDKKYTAKRNMSSAMCASSKHSRLCMKISSFLFVRTWEWAMPRILYLSCGIPFPVWTPDNISGLISVVPWLLRWEAIKKKIR